MHLYYKDFKPSKPLNADLNINTAEDLYQQVRANLLASVYNNWEPQHLFYENFNDVTGKGQFAHPFTGWTTLILLVLSEKYI